jgi:hypothetical protein
MENTVSNKLRLLLNELAILNQPEQIEGKFIYNAHTLHRIKLLSSELYLLADLSQGASLPIVELAIEHQLETHAVEEEASPEIVLEKEAAPEEVPIEEIELPVVEQVETPVPEVLVEAPVEIPVPTPVEVPLVEAAPVVEEVQPVIVEPTVESNPVETSSYPSSLKKREIKISLTRRFEYINNLYSGDANEFMMFIDAVETSLNLSEALGIYEREYNARHWQKRAESADDLKQILKRSF